MSSGHYGVSYKINGHRIGHILRLGKEYHLVFERCYEENTLEEIEKIDWQQVIVEPVRENYPACDLPEGYDWKVYSVNDVVVRKEYIAQAVPVGTSADNPIDYTDGMPLINNAYYRVDGKIKVYMDGWVDWET